MTMAAGRPKYERSFNMREKLRRSLAILLVLALLLSTGLTDGFAVSASAHGTDTAPTQDNAAAKETL